MGTHTPDHVGIAGMPAGKGPTHFVSFSACRSCSIFCSTTRSTPSRLASSDEEVVLDPVELLASGLQTARACWSLKSTDLPFACS